MITLNGYDNARISEPPAYCVPEHRAQDIHELFTTWNNVRTRNQTLRDYYTQHNAMVEISHDEVSDVDVQEVVGWAKATVDSLAMRSSLDGFLFEGVEDKKFSALVRDNALDTDIYPQALISSLIYGVGWLTVMKGKKGQPAAMVRTFSAMQGAGIWDKDNRRLKCGIVLNDVNSDGEATKYTAYWADEVLIFERHRNLWTCESLKSDMGRPLMEPLVFEPDSDRPLGHSRITPEVMRTTDRAMRQLRNLDVGCESYVWPQRWMMGVDRDLFEQHDEEGNVIGINKTRREVYQGKILAMTRDEEGNVPNVGQFAQADVTPLVSAFEQAAQQISGASHIPINELGVLSSNYTSSEALQASTKALVLDVERMNRRNKHTMETIALMMMAISEGKTLDKLTDEQKSVSANFSNPSMPTQASMADANMKIASMDKSYAGTRAFYEHCGWSQADIDRYFAERRQQGAIEALNAIAANTKVEEIEVEDNA